MEMRIRTQKSIRLCHGTKDEFSFTAFINQDTKNIRIGGKLFSFDDILRAWDEVQIGQTSLKTCKVNIHGDIIHVGVWPAHKPDVEELIQIIKGE